MILNAMIVHLLSTLFLSFIKLFFFLNYANSVSSLTVSLFLSTVYILFPCLSVSVSSLHMFIFLYLIYIGHSFSISSLPLSIFVYIFSSFVSILLSNFFYIVSTLVNMSLNLLYHCLFFFLQYLLHP